MPFRLPISSYQSPSPETEKKNLNHEPKKRKVSDAMHPMKTPEMLPAKSGTFGALDMAVEEKKKLDRVFG